MRIQCPRKNPNESNSFMSCHRGDTRRWPRGNRSHELERIFGLDPRQLQELCIFPHLPGDSYDKTAKQLSRFASEVMPLFR